LVLGGSPWLTKMATYQFLRAC